MPLSVSFRFGLLFSSNAPQLPTCTPEVHSVNSALRVKVFPRWYQFAVLEWSAPSEWGNCVFNVYHSLVETGSYEKINPVVVHGNSLIDYSAQDYSKFRQGYYVVEAILLDSSNRTIRSTPVTWQNTKTPWVSLRATEIQRREFLLLRKFTGVKSYLFRKKTYGQHCPNCWDPISETVTKDRCLVCYGTSFTGGYFPPLPVFVQYDPTPNNLQKTYFGKYEPNSISSWAVAVPEAFSDDLLLRIGDWNMYRIGPVQTTELQANPIRQIMTLTQLGKRDIENDLVKTCIAEFPAEFATPTF